MPHRPLVQLAVPLVESQTLLQPPQFPTVLRLVSQPSLKVGPLQSAKPALQVMPHWPLVQLGVPLVELQTVLQPPQ